MPLILNGTTGVSGVDGSAGTPSYQGTDTNTGIFYPAADTIAFAEGGTEVMRIDSSGNVGIGTNAPAYKLHIVGSGTGARARIESTSTANGQLSFINTSTSSTGFVVGLVNDTSGDALIYHQDAKAIQFWTSSTERMRIDSSGNVGIGTSSPDRKLMLLVSPSAASDDGYKLSDGTRTSAFVRTGSSYSYRSVGANTAMLYSSNTLALLADGTSNLTFHNGIGETMRIDSSGRVGIGTSSPVNPLQVAGIIASTSVGSANTGINGSFLYYNASNNAVFASGNSSAVSGTLTPIIFEQNNQVQAVERMRIDSSGNVGIGTSSPSGNFNVNTTGNTQITISAGSTGLSRLVFQGQVANNRGFIDYDNTSSVRAMIFRTDETERMRITSGGVLIVGGTATTAPGGVGTARMQVISSVNDGGWVQTIQSSGASVNRGLAIQYSGATPNDGFNEAMYFTDATAVRFILKSNGGINNYSGNNTNLSDVREKTNIELAGNYLDKICAIPVKTFNYIDQNRETDDGLTLGVIAQDVEAVAPELISESNWGTKDKPKMRLSIYQTDLQYALMKAIQELKGIVDTQATKIAELEAKLK